MKSICHRFVIKAPVGQVYDALTTQEGLAGWWTPDTQAAPEPGSVLRFAFGPTYFKEMEVTELRRPNLIRWRCLKGHEEWIGTTLSFDLQQTDKGTVVSFRHDGWKEYTPEYAGCSYDWAMFFRSLKFLCETGKGFPYPDQYK